MQKFLRLVDLQDLQLVSGISLLGYGLFLVYPPAAFITIGFLLLSPFLLSAWRAK